jgi:PadR family transcriptional regulator PadR
MGRLDGRVRVVADEFKILELEVVDFFSHRIQLYLQSAETVLDKPCTARYIAPMLSKELVAASTVPLVLSALIEAETYGYALIQRVRELSDGRVEWTEGMLYPVLHWMEKEQLIESEWREADTGRKRKYYRISKKGRNALRQEREQWMTIHETLTKLWQRQSSST